MNNFCEDCGEEGPAESWPVEGVSTNKCAACRERFSDTWGRQLLGIKRRPSALAPRRQPKVSLDHITAVFQAAKEEP